MTLKNIIADIGLRMSHPFSGDNVVSFLNSTLRDIRHCSSAMDITEFETTDADMYQLPDYLKTDSIVAVTVDNNHYEPALVEEYTRDSVYYFPLDGYIAFYPSPPSGKTVRISHEVIEYFKTLSEVDPENSLIINGGIDIPETTSSGVIRSYTASSNSFRFAGTLSAGNTTASVNMGVSIGKITGTPTLVITRLGGVYSKGTGAPAFITLSNNYSLGDALSSENSTATIELTDADIAVNEMSINYNLGNTFSNFSFTVEIKDSAQSYYDAQTACVRDEDADLLIYGALVQIANAREDIDLANNYKIEYNALKNQALQRKYMKRGKYPVTRMVF